MKVPGTASEYSLHAPLETWFVWTPIIPMPCLSDIYSQADCFA